MLEAGPVEKFNGKVIGTSDYEEIKDADMVVITAKEPGNWSIWSFRYRTF